MISQTQLDRIVKTLSDKAKHLRAEASVLSVEADILCGLLPITEAVWRPVAQVALQNGNHYIIRRKGVSKGWGHKHKPSDPCVARWDSSVGWIEISGHLPYWSAGIEILVPTLPLS